MDVEWDTNLDAIETGYRQILAALPRYAGAVLFDFIHAAEADAHLEAPKDTLNLTRHIASQVDPAAREAVLRTWGVPYAAAVHFKTMTGTHAYRHPTTPGTKPFFIFDPMLAHSQRWGEYCTNAWEKLFGGLRGGGPMP